MYQNNSILVFNFSLTLQVNDVRSSVWLNFDKKLFKGINNEL